MARTAPELPFLGPARTRILRLLLAGGRTAVQVASDLGIQVSAARKHLERLRETGAVDREFVRGGVGRPKKVYSITPAGRELFPRRYDVVLNAVLGELVKEEGPERAEALVRRQGEEAGRALAPADAPEPARLRRMLEGLNDLGFEASLDRRDGVCVVTSRNCPILKAAQAHRELVCRGLHAEIIRAAAGVSDVERGKWIVDGDAVCVHRFPAHRAPANG